MKMAKTMIDQMVDRFLSWKLPKDFSPDAGISFKPTKPDGYREGYEDGRKASKETIRTLAERNAYLEAEVKRLQGDLYQTLGSTGG
jgi:hypothetical protein